jgi:lysyl-tRNA synthetase class 2
MELGNAFTELNDPDEQAERFAQQAQQEGGEPGDSDYVEALAYGMPPTGGSGSGSTGWRWCSPGTTTSAT